MTAKRVTSTAGKMAKAAAKSTARKVAPKKATTAVKRTAKKASVTTARKTASVRGRSAIAGRYVTPSTASRAPEPVRVEPTPVERAAYEGLTYHAQEDFTLLADDQDVLRIARAIAEHRKDLMDRLAQ